MSQYRYLDKKNKVDFQKDLVSITIANWNSEPYIKKCLDSIKNQTYPHIEVIVVDNNSRDRSLEYIMEYSPDIKVIKNTKNAGFSKAHNMGAHLSKGEYVLPLNFDIFLEPNFISEMIKVMKNNPKIGIISGKLYKQINGEKSKLIDSTGIMMEHCFMRPRGETEEDRGQYDTPENFNVFGACGAAPFYRREMLEDIKCFNEFFDEDFVNYVEDVDLSWRAILRNWKCVYNPRAVAYHERGATRKKDSKMQEDYLIYGFRNRYCTMIKNIPQSYWKKNRFKIIGKEAIFLLGSIKHIPKNVRLKALWLALKMLKKMLAKRKIIQRRNLVSDSYIDTLLCYNGLETRR